MLLLLSRLNVFSKAETCTEQHPTKNPGFGFMVGPSYMQVSATLNTFRKIRHKSVSDHIAQIKKCQFRQSSLGIGLFTVYSGIHTLLSQTCSPRQRPAYNKGPPQIQVRDLWRGAVLLRSLNALVHTLLRTPRIIRKPRNMIRHAAQFWIY